MIKPTSFDTAMTEAELAAFTKICTATGTTPGKGGFLGRNMGIADSFFFSFARIGVGSDELISSTDFPTMVFPAFAQLQYRSRARVQEFIMQVLRALPVLNDPDTCLHQMRVAVGGISEIGGDFYPMANEPKPVWLWEARISFDVAFITGGKSNSI